MKSAACCLLALLCGLATPLFADPLEPLVYEGDHGPGVGKHIVFLAGDHEYRSEETLPELARILARHHGFKCTVLFTVDPKTGEIVPGSSNMPGTEALETADLMVIFLRFQDFPAEQMQPIVDYLARGGPVVGLRTSTHAFKIPEKSPFARFSFQYRGKDFAGGFGRQVLGETWAGHYGRNHAMSTRLELVEKESGHPILRGVKDVWVQSGGYWTDPQPDSEVLALAQPLNGMKQDSPVAEEKKPCPGAWVRSYKLDGGKSGRVFATTYGASEDILNDGYRRMLVNACFWAAGMEDKIAPAAEIALVGPYHPSTFRFGGYRKGVKPLDLAGWDSPIMPDEKTTAQRDAATPASKQAKSKPAKAEQSKAEKPNFIVINIDDMGYADIEPYGSKLNRTPNLNRLAAEGRKLTCFYAAPVCSPSRASLMTGCYPKRCLPIPHVLFPGNAEGLDPGEVTIAELLKQQGYTTGIIGKWHLGDQPVYMPTRQGFDSFFGLPYSNDMGPAEDGVKSSLGAPLPKRRGKGQPPLPWLRNETVLQRVLADDQTTLVERYTNEAVHFLEKNKDKPFFLYLPHSAVHFPIYPGKAFQGKSNNGIYGDWVEEVDWSVGRVLDTVRKLGLDRNTLVLFTSDNGGTPRAVNAPLRGFKGSTWEGGMREPTIAWWPGKIPAGTATDEITGMIDVLPTLVKLAGGRPPEDRKIDGGDIWPLLAGESGAKSPHDVYYYYRGLNLQAVRSGDWKLHLAKGELYNLKTDIGESKDVAAANADEVKRLRGLADEMKTDLGLEGIGPGVRPLGKVKDPKPIIDHDGNVRPEFRGPASVGKRD